MVYFSQKSEYPHVLQQKNSAGRETLYKVRKPGAFLAPAIRAEEVEVVPNAKNSSEVICVYSPP
jgi:hypothetical protein